MRDFVKWLDAAALGGEYIHSLSAVDQRIIEEFHAERERRPNLEPYVGPSDTLERFLAGAGVTHREFVLDDSLWTVRNLDPAVMRRLRFMLDSTKCDARASGSVCECRP